MKEKRAEEYRKEKQERERDAREYYEEFERRIREIDERHMKTYKQWLEGGKTEEGTKSESFMQDR